MAIYTPRGLKVRVPVPYAFGLMARLYPQVSAFRILKTTEGLDHVPGVLSFIAAIVALLLGWPPIQVGLAVTGATLLGTVASAMGLVFPGLVHLATAVSYVSGYGLFNLVVVVVGALTAGWYGPIAYVVGKAVGFVLAWFVESWQCARLHRLTGMHLTASEQSFLNAYRLHASRHGTTTNIDLTDAETERENWQTCYADLAERWPEVVSRFEMDAASWPCQDCGVACDNGT